MAAPSVEPRLSLALRRRRGRPVLPETLEAETGLSSRQVVEAIANLAELGFAIESVPHQGYRLADVPPQLIPEELACDLPTLKVGRRIICLGQTDSTNDVAWAALVEGPAETDGLAVFAEYQSAGRGRRGNRWLAPPHSSILCSVLVWCSDPVTPGALTRAVALAVAEAIEDHSHLAVGIKWPNDLVIDDRKVAGVLVETRFEAGAAKAAVIGIGINCHQTPEAFPPHIRPAVASLKMFREDADRTLLARALLERLDAVLAELGDPPSTRRLQQRADRRCCTIGQQIVIADNSGTYRGRVADLDGEYALVVRLEGGGIRTFSALTSHVLSFSDAGA